MYPTRRIARNASGSCGLVIWDFLKSALLAKTSEHFLPKQDLG
jgi:hypothetical protein